MNSRDKLGLLKKTFGLLIDNLQERDRVAIVTYAGNAGIALPPTSGSDRSSIRAAINGLGAGGSTAGAQGIETAYALASQIIAEQGDDAAQTRVLLATDGDFNVGTTNNEALVALIKRYAEKNIFLNTIGFGTGNFQDQRMEKLSNDGNGVYSYIDSLNTAKQLFGEDLMGQLFTVAKDTKVQIFFNPAAVAAWRQIGYANRQLKREDFNNDNIDAGDIGAGHQVTALYEIVPVGVAIPNAVDGNPFITNDTPVKTELTDVDGDNLAQLRFRFKDPEATTSQLHEEMVSATVQPMDANTAWAATMAGFGMQLRHSPYVGAWQWDDLLAFASTHRPHFSDTEADEAMVVLRRAAVLAQSTAQAAVP